MVTLPKMLTKPPIILEMSLDEDAQGNRVTKEIVIENTYYSPKTLLKSIEKNLTSSDNLVITIDSSYRATCDEKEYLIVNKAKCKLLDNEMCIEVGDTVVVNDKRLPITSRNFITEEQSRFLMEVGCDVKD